MPTGVHPPKPIAENAGSAPLATASVTFVTNSGIAGGSGIFSKAEKPSVLANLREFERVL